MNPIDCREKLVVLLNAHTAKMSTANEYLVNIKNAIAENKIDTLSRTLTEPTLPVDDIEVLELQRHQLLASYGFSEDFDGFEKCVAWCDNDRGEIAELYQKLVQSLVQLQHSIQLNSLLVNKGKDRIRRSIGILTGLGNPSSHKTYSSEGKTLQSSELRDIAIA
ncbi:MAG: flagellar biosynthesis/type III secretory pathway chaperone [Planctomycetota bacterium]|jgi:flagellar biosynthesis/type III secretory pathway chaperone